MNAHLQKVGPLLAGLLLVATVGSLFIIFDESKPPNIAPAAQRTITERDTILLRAASNPANDAISEERGHLAGGLSPQEYLDQSSNKSLALFSLWRASGDPTYFDALKTRVRLEPEASVLLAVELRRKMKQPVDSIDYLRTGAESFPQDVVIGLSLAGSEAALGNHEAAFDALQRAAGSGAGDFGANSRQQAMRVWLIGSGMSEEQAWILATKNEMSTQFALAGIVQSSNALVKNVKTSGTPETKLELAKTILTLAHQLNPTEDIIEDPHRSLRVLEMTALKLFPEDTPFGDDGQTTGQRLKEIQSDFATKDIFIQSQLNPFLKAAPAKVSQEFEKRKEREGLRSAVEWVRGVMKEGRTGKHPPNTALQRVRALPVSYAQDPTNPAHHPGLNTTNIHVRVP